MTKIPVSPDLQALPASLSAAWVKDALVTLERLYGIAPARLMAEAGLDPAVLANPSALLPLIDVLRVFVRAFAITRDHAIGVRLGAAVQIRSYPVLGYAIMGSANLGEAIRQLQRYERVVGELGRATLLDDGGDDVFLRWECPIPMPWARYVRDAAVAGWIGVARAVLEGVDAPLEAHFEHVPLTAAEESVYAEVFRCPVRFGMPMTGVRIPRAWLTLPLKSADPALGELMERHANELLADFGGGINLVSEVRSAIYRRLSGGEPDVESVAGDLGLTGRALQARLRKADLTFSDLVDEVRKSLASVLVGDDGMSLVNVAFLLGFAEQSSFTRAFRRWYGVAPGEYRRR